MIEPFDAKRHEALLDNSPFTYVLNNPTTHKLDAPSGIPIALCRTAGDRLAVDWRLVNCVPCREAAPTAA